MNKPSKKPVQPEVAAAKPKSIRFWVSMIIAVVIFVACMIILLDNVTPNTDDAYVYANVVRISPQVSGRVEKVYVFKDEPVKKGQKLFKLDPRPYQHRVNSLKAAYVKSISDVKLLHQEVKQAEQDVASLSAQVKLAEVRFSDYKRLVDDGAISQFTYITAAQNLKDLQAQLQGNKIEQQKTITNIEATINGKNVVSEEALANLRRAEFDLQQTLVVAPRDGYVTNVTLLPGMYTDAGTAALTFVDRSKWWVIANLKENNMFGVKIGQSADLAISMYPGKIFHGTVARMPEGVNVHSTVPPIFLPYVEKTPNWIRLAQRFPVWIHFDPSQFGDDVPRIGTTTTVVIYRKGNSFVNLIAKVLIRINSYLYYLY